jgi:hypothetical protein
MSSTINPLTPDLFHATLILMAQSIEDIFRGFGGTSAFARVFAIPQSTASEMKRRKRIPVRYWPRLVTEAERRRIKGVNYDMLVGLHAPEAAE